EIVQGSEVWIDDVIVAHGIGAAVGTFALLHANRVNGHQPEHGHAQVLQLIQFRRHSVKVRLLRKSAWKDFINDCLTQPLRGSTSGAWEFGYRTLERESSANPEKQNRAGPLNCFIHGNVFHLDSWTLLSSLIICFSLPLRGAAIPPQIISSLFSSPRPTIP